MVYAPQRRHAVASLANAAQALGLLQHLYAPNALILVARILVQMQIAAAAFVHPTRSLFALFAMLTLLNVTAVMLHLLDYASGSNGGKGLMLDFVGQAHPASLTRILLLDLLIYGLQITCLVVSYITHHDTNIPATPRLPVEDLLLPSEDATTQVVAIEDDQIDIESGEGSRRRKGKGLAYTLEGNPDLWLNEADQGEDDAGMDASDRSRLLSSTAGTSKRRRSRDPPHIFSLSIPHLINLIIRLPAPLPASRAFSGGTPPDGTPNAQPSTELPPPLSSATTTVVETAHTASEDEWESDLENTDGRSSPSARRERRSRDAAGAVEDIGRIPGAYRTTGESGDGG